MIGLRPLPSDLLKSAIEKLNEVPERLTEEIQTLKTWIDQQPYLNARTDDQFLVAFLRGCNHSLEKSKSKIDYFYTFRTKYPDLFTLKDAYDPQMLKLIQLGFGLPLPTPLNDHGPRIHLIRPGCYSANEFSFENIICLANACQLITLLEDDYAVVNGYVHVMDMTNLSGAHILQMTPNILKKTSAFIEEAIPLTQRATHFINTSSAFETFFNKFKPLLPKEKQDRLFVHGGNLDGFYDHVPQKYLPKEYGGENGCIEELISKTESKFLEYRDFLMDDLKYGTIENLRPESSLNLDSTFGTSGSFRKIDID